MISLQQFEDQHTGDNRVGNTPENIGECVGLVSVWMDSLGIPHEWGNAAELLNDADTQYVDVIINTPTNVPSPGDILVWGRYDPYRIGAVGHTAIFVRGGTDSFTSFDQNWPTGAACTEVNHPDYGGVLGWLHPKAIDQSNEGEKPMPVLDLARARVLSWGVLGRNGFDGTTNALNGEADADLNANHVGKDPYAEIWDYFNSPEGKDWIDNRLPAIYKTAANLKAEVIAQKSLIDSLRAQVNSLQVVPPVVVSPAPLADTNSDGLLKRLVEQITTWVKGTK